MELVPAGSGSRSPETKLPGLERSNRAASIERSKGALTTELQLKTKGKFQPTKAADPSQGRKSFFHSEPNSFLAISGIGGGATADDLDERRVSLFSRPKAGSNGPDRSPAKSYKRRSQGSRKETDFANIFEGLATSVHRGNEDDLPPRGDKPFDVADRTSKSSNEPHDAPRVVIAILRK